MPFKSIAVATLVAIAAAALSTPAGASVVGDWNATALAEVRLARLGPPIVARALAVSHTCIYDAWPAWSEAGPRRIDALLVANPRI